MGYVCATCGGKDFPNKKLLAEHLVEEHGSVFLEGDADLIRFSQAHAEKLNTAGNGKGQQAKKAMVDAGVL